MTLKERLLCNWIEAGIHPNQGSFFIKIVLLSLGFRFQFTTKMLKSRIFYCYKSGTLIGFSFLGFEIMGWYYV